MERVLNGSGTGAGPLRAPRLARIAVCAVGASLALAATAQGHTKPVLMRLQAGATLGLESRGAATVIVARVKGRTMRTVLPVEDGIYRGSLEGATLLGAIGGAVAVISVDYASNPSGGRFQCGAGVETMIRVIALSPRPHQTFGQLVASCWAPVDAGDVTWDRTAHLLTIERTTYSRHAAPGSGTTVADTRTTYRIAPDGSVTPVRVEDLP